MLVRFQICQLDLNKEVFVSEMKRNRYNLESLNVDAPGGNIRDAFMPYLSKEPSATLLQLMGIVVQAGQRFAAIADMQVGTATNRPLLERPLPS